MSAMSTFNFRTSSEASWNSGFIEFWHFLAERDLIAGPAAQKNEVRRAIVVCIKLHSKLMTDSSLRV